MERDRRTSQGAIPGSGTNVSQARRQPLLTGFPPLFSTLHLYHKFFQAHVICLTPLGWNRCPFPIHTRYLMIISIIAISTLSDCFMCIFLEVRNFASLVFEPLQR